MIIFIIIVVDSCQQRSEAFWENKKWPRTPRWLRRRTHCDAQRPSGVSGRPNPPVYGRNRSLEEHADPTSRPGIKPTPPSPPLRATTRTAAAPPSKTKQTKKIINPISPQPSISGHRTPTLRHLHRMRRVMSFEERGTEKKGRGTINEHHVCSEIVYQCDISSDDG